MIGVKSFTYKRKKSNPRIEKRNRKKLKYKSKIFCLRDKIQTI